MTKRTALITGASSGIGAEFARVLAADGMNLVLVARRAERLEELRKEIERGSDASCRVIAMDLSSPEAPEELYRSTQSHGCAVDWLINNAGFGTNGAFAELPLDREHEEIRLNIGTLIGLCRLYLPDMIVRGRGQIINLGSVGSFTPSPYMATYSATKAFVLSFSEALATELAGTGVNVLALCPGATRTEFQRVAGVKGIPEARFMSAEEVVRQAVAAARANRRLLVPGLMNKVAVASTRLMPLTLVARIAGSILRPKSPE